MLWPCRPRPPARLELYIVRRQSVRNVIELPTKPYKIVDYNISIENFYNLVGICHGIQVNTLAFQQR